MHHASERPVQLYAEAVRLDSHEVRCSCSVGGGTVNRIQIRDYSGDFEDVAELSRRVWTSEYGGKMWFPLWDAIFFRWQVGAQSGALRPVAYYDTKLVGTFFSIPHVLRIGSSSLPIGLASWCAVDPDYRHMQTGPRLIRELSQRHEELGLAFSLGVVAGDPTSVANRFWTQYAITFPQRLRFLFRFGFWVKVLAPIRVARAGIEAWERLSISALGPFMRVIPFRRDPDVRPYRVGDLERCTQLLQKSTGGLEWALLWSPTQLADQLCSLASGTLVLDLDGQVRGMVNYHHLSFQCREPVRAALIDLWADDDLSTVQRARLLGHLCRDLRERDVHLVLALRSAMMPAAPFVANAFLPQPAHHHFVALFPGDIPLSPPKTWSLMMR
jgi:hypothetical protein